METPRPAPPHSLLVAVLTAAGLVFGFAGPSAAQIQLPPGYEIEVLFEHPTNHRFGDIAFAPNGDLVFASGNASRVPCDSYIGNIEPDGTVGFFATPCIDGPVSIAFGPFTGDTLFMVESAGFDDTMYTIEPGAGPGEAQVYLRNQFVVHRDILFHPNGDLYLSDAWQSKLFRILPDRTVETVGTVPRLYDHEILRLALDSVGTLYLSHRGNGTIYAFSPEDQRSVYSTAFARPSAIAVDGKDNLWVANQGAESSTLEILAPDGTIYPWASGLPFILRLQFGPDGLLYAIVGGDIVRFRRTSIEASLEIRPGVLNLGSSGRWVTAWIELPEDYDPAMIEVSSLRLEDAVPAAERPVQIGDHDGDGVADLMVKFDRQALAALLEPGDTVAVTVSGTLEDGTMFAGSDILVVIDPGGGQ